MTKNEINKRIEEAERIYTKTLNLKDSASARYGADVFQDTCEQLLLIVAELRSRIEQLERENAPLVKPQPKGVRVDGWLV